jgi:hypothetical protein
MTPADIPLDCPIEPVPDRNKAEAIDKVIDLIAPSIKTLAPSKKAILSVLEASIV